ncbi:unnamed protein product [Allacma fusca]|uniref:Formin GTPase-binding domain-containing protein n=1 Tax=Allacma fusca TaxID=39272 RepID=A0A8J2JWM7_9HEXA|nr:unnamed protein product [Allacma fusca]
MFCEFLLAHPWEALGIATGIGGGSVWLARPVVRCVVGITFGLGLGITRNVLPGMEWWVNRTIATVDKGAGGVRDWATRVWHMYANDCGNEEFSPLQNVTTGQTIQDFGRIEEEEKDKGGQQCGGSKEEDEDGLGDDGLCTTLYNNSSGGSSNLKNGIMGSVKSSGGAPTTINNRRSRQSRHLSKLSMGDDRDDIHVCILCLRAIMDNEHGVNMVIQKQEFINVIALSLRYRSLRTNALVPEILAAVCLV